MHGAAAPIYAHDLSPFQKIRALSWERKRGYPRRATSKYRHYPGNIGIYMAIDNLLLRAMLQLPADAARKNRTEFDSRPEREGDGIKMTEINTFRSINHRLLRGNIDITPLPSSLIPTPLLTASSNEAVILFSRYINTRTHSDLTSVVLAATKTLLSSVNDAEVYILRKASLPLSIPLALFLSLAHYFLALYSFSFPFTLAPVSPLDIAENVTYLRSYLIFMIKIRFRFSLAYGNFILIEKHLKSPLRDWTLRI